MGFRDGKGYHATLLTGDQEISPFEWIEEGKAYREWLIPAA